MMKLSKIISVAAATVVMAAATCVTAFAATNIKVGDCGVADYDDEELYKVSITVSSTDYDNITDATVNLSYDTSKYTVYGATYFAKNNKGKVKETAFDTYNEKKDDGYVLLAYASTYGLDISDSEDTVMINVYFNETTASADDFKVTKVTSIGSLIGGSAVSVTESSEFATYVKYKVPKTVGSDWKYGFVTNINAYVFEAGTDTQLGTVKELKNYIDEGDYYVFVIKLVPSSAGKRVDVKVKLMGYEDEELTKAKAASDYVTVASNVSVGYYN